MQAKPRSGRRSGFGGLLDTPKPLPDDDDTQAVGEEAAASTPPAALKALPTEPEPVTDQAEDTEPDPERPSAPQATEQETRPARASSKAAPATIRLNEKAGPELWDAYLEEKVRDPFLSYRQFASDVVADGLAARRRRQKR